MRLRVYWSLSVGGGAVGAASLSRRKVVRRHGIFLTGVCLGALLGVFGGVGSRLRLVEDSMPLGSSDILPVA